MSTNTSTANSSANNSTHSTSHTNNNPHTKKSDGTQIVYSWLPHSTALGASSTVAVRVRNANLSFSSEGRVGDGGGGLGTLGSGIASASLFTNFHNPLEDEKKYNESNTNNEAATNNGILGPEGEATAATIPIYTHECRVEASLHAFGLPLQAAPISTRHAPLIPLEYPMESISSAHPTLRPVSSKKWNALDVSHPEYACGKEWATAAFDTIVSLPVRWRDLTRDACLALNVFCDGDWDKDSIIGNVNLSMNDNEEGGSDDSSLCPKPPKVWGTTLPLFDEHGRLRSGLYKLKLYPDVLADGGMRYASRGTDENDSSNDAAPIETFLDGGATPGLSGSDERNNHHSHPGWFDGRKLNSAEEEDPKWKASLILHKLSRLESSAPNNAGATASSVGAALPTSTNSRSASWLDALTKERCLDILRERDDDTEVEILHNQGGRNTQPNHMSPHSSNRHSGVPAPTSSNHNTPYLIIELPTPPIPILHEEPLYPVETSSHLRGTTGSITANELIKFHSKFRTEDEPMSGWGGVSVRVSPLAMEWSSTSSSGKNNAANASGESSSTQNGKSHNVDAILSTLPHPQAFLYPLVQTIDHEPPLTDENETPQDNPAQDKYRILAHDLIRGLVDPGLKPDRAQRGRLERIVGSPSYHLSTEEKDLLWRFRFSLVDNRRALTKFLLAVDWTVESEVVQAAELLEQWRKRSPIEVTDALKLLGRNVAFQTSLVRSYAIETLSGAPDEELRLYLLQLVQALKYEEDVSGGTSSGNMATNAYTQSETGGTKARVSSLATFLIERASRNVKLANFLYWYLRVEMLNPIYEARYREVFLSFEEKLNSVRVKDGIIMHPSKHSEKSGTGSISLWELLTHQEQFISGIMECQRNSLLVRGKKDAKETNLREALDAGGFRNIPHAVPLPSAPHIFVKGVNPSSVRMFKSALYPAVVEFIVDRVEADGSKNGQQNGTIPSKTKSDLSTYKVMIKTGDDLRQDQLVIMMIQLMDRLLKRGTLDLCLKPYSIMAMPQNSGLVEFVEGSIPVSQILSNNNNSIMTYFQHVAPDKGARHSIKHDVLQTYIRSCAGYCVLTYLLGVGDRHLDNIMIQPSGHFFHIDFGFIFGRDPKPLPPAFRLTKEMVDGMGGTDSSEYRQFCSLACQAFNVIRKSAGLVLNLLHLMSDAGIEDLSNNPSADAIGVIAKVEERFKLELTDEQAESFFLGLISESLAALAPRVTEFFHQLAVARR